MPWKYELIKSLVCSKFKGELRKPATNWQTTELHPGTIELHPRMVSREKPSVPRGPVQCFLGLYL